MAAKNFSDASFFIEAGQIPTIKIIPDRYQDETGRQHVNAQVQVDAEGNGFSLKLSLPIAALKGLIAVASEFMDEPGTPDLDVVPGAGGCYSGFSNMN